MSVCHIDLILARMLNSIRKHFLIQQNDIRMDPLDILGPSAVFKCQWKNAKHSIATIIMSKIVLPMSQTENSISFIVIVRIQISFVRWMVLEVLKNITSAFYKFEFKCRNHLITRSFIRLFVCVWTLRYSESSNLYQCACYHWFFVCSVFKCFYSDHLNWHSPHFAAHSKATGYQWKWFKAQSVLLNVHLKVHS